MTKRTVKLSIYCLAAAIVVGIVLLGYAYFIEPTRLVVNEYEIKVKKWDPAFSGLRIAAISDIHGGSNGVDAAKLRQIVETTNAQSPDVIVLLGDFVSQARSEPPVVTGGETNAATNVPPITIGGSDRRRTLKMPVSEIASGLAGFSAKYGVFVVLGNHDGWFDNSEIATAFRSQNYTVLDGELAEITKDGHTLRVLGLKDHLSITNWGDFSNAAKSLLENSDAKGSVLILEHGPDIAPIITGDLSITDDAKLMLSGHTHGGQISLPILGRPIVPSSYGQKYAAGHFTEGDMDVFVTTGIGTSILPLRFMVPPEIAIVTVVTEPPM